MDVDAAVEWGNYPPQIARRRRGRNQTTDVEMLAFFVAPALQSRRDSFPAAQIKRARTRPQSIDRGFCYSLCTGLETRRHITYLLAATE